MSSVNVQTEINNMQSATAQYQAANGAKNMGTSTLDSNAFLKLMLQELQYQDPTDPVDNKEMIAQQAQLSQLTETQKMSQNTANSNAIMQALNLIGAKVALTDPGNTKNTIVGVVAGTTIDGANSTISVNGKDYPLSSIKAVTVATADDVAASQAAADAQKAKDDAAAKAAADAAAAAAAKAAGTTT